MTFYRQWELSCVTCLSLFHPFLQDRLKSRMDKVSRPEASSIKCFPGQSSLFGLWLCGFRTPRQSRPAAPRFSGPQSLLLSASHSHLLEVKE